MFLEKIVCCYHRLTAYLIQYCILICNIIGIILIIIGLLAIKWRYISGAIQFLYIICLIIYIFGTLCILIIIYFRRNKTINKRNNKPSIKISIANIVLSFFGVLFSIICLIYCWIKYKDNKVKGWKKFWMFFCLGGNIRVIFFVIFSWISIYLRLRKKTSGAYIAKKEEQSISNESTISSIRNVKVSYGVRELNLK